LIKRSDLADIQLMLKHGADPTLANQVNSWTALHCFAWRGEDVNALDVLLNHAVNGVKPDINARDDEGNTPLHVLLWRRQVPKVLLQAFVSRGANVNEENNNSARPLQMACLYGDLDTLKVLCHSDVISEIDDEDNDGDTALQQAAIGNHTGLVKFLVEFGANPNVPNHSGKVALHNSALKGTRDCIEILLSNGASPNLFDNHNRTPLFCACLGAAATEDKAKILLDTLLGMNVPLSEINSPTTSQRTPLREAAAHGFKYVVAKLIDTAKARNDFDSLALNEPDTSKGMTPLHRAVWFGRTDCVSLLLAANADVKLCDKDGKTALTLAIEQWALASHDGAFENILSLLIDADPEAAAADPELVAVCAMNGSSRLLQKLVDIGADLNRQDRYGWTPIELARNYQQEEASRFLKKQAAWAGMLPSQWAKNPRTAIAGNGTTIEHTSGKRVCISTNTPLPAGLDSFYFEIIIYPALGVESNGSDVNYPVLAIGFCTIGGSAILFPGWPPHEAAPGARSWGYHGSDGCFFDSRTEDGDEVTTKIPYGAGNIVGCGVDLTTQTIWFTRNGQRLGSEFKNVQGRLFPLLGLKDAVIVETNFTGPFMWQEDDETGAVKTNK
jgi:ankyrin repeat protein